MRGGIIAIHKMITVVVTQTTISNNIQYCSVRNVYYPPPLG